MMLHVISLRVPELPMLERRGIMNPLLSGPSSVRLRTHAGRSDGPITDVRFGMHAGQLQAAASFGEFWHY